MTYCEQCGAEVPQNDEFCSRCGARVTAPTGSTPPATSPAPSSSSQPAAPPDPPVGAGSPTARPAVSRRSPAAKLLPVVVAALVVVVGGIGWLLFAKPSGTSSAGSARTTAAPPPTHQQAQGTTTKPAAPTSRQTASTTTAKSTPSTTSPSLDPETAAQQQIQQISAADRVRVAGVLGQWIPQLSSKQVGLSDPADPWFPGQPYTNQMILQAYKNYQQQYPGAMLLNSSDYSSFTYPGYWVIVLDLPFSSQDETLDWCTARGISRDNCIGTKIHN